MLAAAVHAMSMSAKAPARRPLQVHARQATALLTTASRVSNVLTTHKKHSWATPYAQLPLVSLRANLLDNPLVSLQANLLDNPLVSQQVNPQVNQLVYLLVYPLVYPLINLLTNPLHNPLANRLHNPLLNPLDNQLANQHGSRPARQRLPRFP